MKTSLKFVSLVLFLSLFVSCHKKGMNDCNCDTFTSAEVFKDCTGTYIRVSKEGSDGITAEYNVCNPDILKNKESGANVSVCYKSVDKCGCSDGTIVCEMLHEHDGFVKVNKVQ